MSDSTLRLIVIDLTEKDAFSMATTLLKLILLPYRAWFTEADKSSKTNSCYDNEIHDYNNNYSTAYDKTRYVCFLHVTLVMLNKLRCHVRF